MKNNYLKYCKNSHQPAESTTLTIIVITLPVQLDVRLLKSSCNLASSNAALRCSLHGHEKCRISTLVCH